MDTSLPTVGLPRSLAELYMFLQSAPQLVNVYDERITSDAAATEIPLGSYETRLTTGGSEGSEDATLGDGTGAVVGQRKLVTLKTVSEVGDLVALDHDNVVDTDGSALAALELDAEDEFVLVEWNGSAWQIVHANATVTGA